MKNVIYYFTGTGNSLSVARKLAAKLDGTSELRPLAALVDRSEIPVGEADTVGFVFPIYGSDTPWPVKAAAQHLKLTGTPYCWAIGTCNERGGTCMDTFTAFLRRYGITLSYAKKLDMPGNCLESNAAENAERLELEDVRVERFARNINARFVGSSHAADSPQNTAEATRARFHGALDAWKVDETRCTGCGTCASLCPMGNITLTEGKPVFGDKCAVCFGCFHFCPAEAIGTGMEALNSRTRYHHPDVTAEDIGAQRG